MMVYFIIGNPLQLTSRCRAADDAVNSGQLQDWKITHAGYFERPEERGKEGRKEEKEQDFLLKSRLHSARDFSGRNEEQSKENKDGEEEEEDEEKEEEEEEKKKKKKKKRKGRQRGTQSTTTETIRGAG
ncbi:pre-rRNA-processing protein ESF2-like [Camponotus floridanus]|uniref:pre-rRNA-processing protein ESF2-like n=1 Tax=Camponotus floridanus TaxID=104421 RepID=UPI000DC676AD|nr:pre-rRNA-processing protein ESF2-like [Camponotus floridanus]XP_025266164.1 pre-rRNA-processing protein ESF2-like [Camponotus floridanus]